MQIDISSRIISMLRGFRASTNVGLDGILSSEEFPIATRPTDGLQHGFVRADMVYFETPSDGAVFSVGSIAWVTSLSHNGFDNNVARITGNVLKRFLDPRPTTRQGVDPRH